MKTPITTEQFLKRFLPAAQYIERLYGMPAYYTLAMHLSEQGRNLTPPGNMCFGIKADKNWKGKRQLLSTWEVYNSAKPRHEITLSVVPMAGGLFRHNVKDYFRAYDSLEASYADHADFLKKNRRYAGAWLVAKGDDVEFARAVAAAGYATDPQKFAKLRDLIVYLKKKAGQSGLPLVPAAPDSLQSPFWPTTWSGAADSAPAPELGHVARPGAAG